MLLVSILYPNSLCIQYLGKKYEQYLLCVYCVFRVLVVISCVYCDIMIELLRNRDLLSQ